MLTSFLRLKILIFCCFFLSGCASLIDGRYARDSDSDINLRVVMHVKKMRDAYPIAGDVVVGANNVLMHRGMRITHVEIIDDIEKNLRVKNTNNYVMHSKFYKMTREDPGALHVMIVDKIERPRSQKENIRGIMIKNEANACFVYIAITQNASMLTLAHEIGHMFGLDHVDDHRNVMKTGARREDASFTKEQLNTIIKNYKRYVDKCVTNQKG